MASWLKAGRAGHSAHASPAPASPLQAPSLWLPLQLVGCTAGAASMLLLPGALACTLGGWRRRGVLLLLLGLLMMAAGFASAVFGR